MPGSRPAFFILCICSLSGAGCEPDIGTAFKPDRGPHEVTVESPVALPFPALDKKLMIRVTYPESKGPFPVIVFSHGGRCSRDLYTDFAEHWASHGYVVLQPAHLDSVSIERPKTLGGTQLMAEADRTRRLDMQYILDSLDRIQALVPGLAGKVDSERIVAAGHSLGGGTAMTVTGLVLVDSRNETSFGFTDDRFDALLLITNPGNSPLMPEDPWRAVSLPTFIATGTDDFSGIARRIKRGFGYSFPEGIIFPDTPNHYLFIEDMNHYLGGLICRSDAEGDPDYEAIRIINGVSVAFLDAYVKDDATALAYLQAGGSPDPSSQRAILEIR